MIFLICGVGLSILVAAGCIDVFTIQSVLRQRRRKTWITVTTMSLLVGLTIGYWCAFEYRYAFGENKEAIGFPIPVVIFQWEDGHWVDYVGNPLLAFVSCFLVASAFLWPVAISLLLVRLFQRYTASPS